MRVTLSGDSEKDLLDIALEIARDSPRPARSYIAEIRAACLSLAHHPERFPVVIDDPEPLRRIVHGSHLIFYAIRHDHIRISRIIHSARLTDPSMFL